MAWIELHQTLPTNKKDAEVKKHIENQSSGGNRAFVYAVVMGG